MHIRGKKDFINVSRFRILISGYSLGLSTLGSVSSQGTLQEGGKRPREGVVAVKAEFGVTRFEDERGHEPRMLAASRS